MATSSAYKFGVGDADEAKEAAQIAALRTADH
jgi:hypothetical protein